MVDICHNSPFVGNPPRHDLCLFPPGLPTNSNILRKMRLEVLMMTMIMVIFKTMIMVIYKTMTMVIFEAMMMVVMTRVTQSGSRLCRKFPFLLFALFSPSGRRKTTKTARFSNPLPPLLLHFLCVFVIFPMPRQMESKETC